MGYRRLFIMRKDLEMSPGKLAAQVAHCTEAYWTNMLRKGLEVPDVDFLHHAENARPSIVFINREILNEYVMGSFVKTICRAKNKNDLLKAKAKAEELGLVEGEDFGLIFDNCRTELVPEEENGTTLTGIWFRPLPDDVAHEISRKYQLYS